MYNLIHGDCFEEIKTLKDGSIDLVVTDPPYSFENIKGSGIFSDSNLEQYNRKRSIDNLRSLEKLDSVSFKPEEILEALRPKMKRFYGYFFCNKLLVADYINWATQNGYSFDILTMIKSNPIPAHSTHHCCDTEYIILIRDKGVYFNGKGLEFDNYRKWFMTSCTKRIHPAEKPVELLERFVNVSCPKEGVVLDPFMGSGSTGIACLNSLIDFIGIEKDSGYFEVARKRIKEREDDLNGVGSLFEGIA